MESVRSKLLFGFSLLLMFIIGQSVVFYVYFQETSELVRQAIDQNFKASTDFSNTWSASDKHEIQRWRLALNTYGRGFRKVVRQVEDGEINTTLDANAAIQLAKNAFRVLLNGVNEKSEQKFSSADLTREQVEKILLRLKVLRE